MFAECFECGAGSALNQYAGAAKQPSPEPGASNGSTRNRCGRPQSFRGNHLTLPDCAEAQGEDTDFPLLLDGQTAPCLTGIKRCQLVECREAVRQRNFICIRPAGAGRVPRRRGELR